MKKIVIILFWAICLVEMAKAQTPVFSYGFGVPSNGTVYVAWDAGGYVIQTTGGNSNPEYFSDYYDDLAADIAENYDWISLGSVTGGQPSGCFQIHLTLDNNTSSYSRSFIYGNPAQSQAITIIQRPVPESYPTLSPQGVHKIIPGERTTIYLNGTTSGVNYYLRDANDQLIATIVGTGGNDSWTGLLTPGSYYVNIPDGDFSVVYKRLCSYNLGFDGDLVEIGADGGVSILNSEDIRDDQNGNLPWEYEEPVPELDSLSVTLNTGQSIYWDSNIQFSYEITEEGYLNLLFSAPPNMTSDTLKCSFYKASGELFFSIVQPGGGHLADRDVRFVESGNKVTARVSNSQYGVLYRIYRDDVLCSVANGTAYMLILEAPSGGDDYRIEAVLNQQSLEIARAERINSQLLVLPSGRSWTLAQHFNTGGVVTNDVAIANGLGYADQELLVGAAGNGSKDLVQTHSYDYLFRERKSFLPFVENTYNGNLLNHADEKQENYYRRLYGGSGNPYAYTENDYESSAANRVLSLTKPGRVYRSAEKHITYDYGANGNGQVFKLEIISDNALYVNGYYDANSLNRETVSDEDGGVTEIYTDMDDRIVLERRRLNASTWAETYYAFDAFGRPVWVISPEGSRQLTSGHSYEVPDDEETYADNALQKYSYVYEYDKRGQTVSKHIPGSACLDYRYDDAGRIVRMQDGNLREKSQWVSYVYDALGRKTAESLVANTGVDSTSLREFVYDSYPSGMTSALQYHAVAGITQAGNEDLHDSRTEGLLTYEKLRILGTAGYLEKAYYYDLAGNIIQTNEKYPDGSILSTSTRYDLQGNVLTVKRDAIFCDGQTTHALVESYSYDNRGRLLQSTSILDGTDQSTIGYVYDDLGRISTVQYGNGATETLQYNMQGWRTTQNVRRFGQTLFNSSLRYYDTFNGSTTPCYSGNISSWTWTQSGQSAQTYVFTYDPMSRLTGTRHYTGNTETNRYKEDMTYDRNGNILTMIHVNNGSTRGLGGVYYDGNRRMGDYLDYDANGNLIAATDEEYPLWMEYNLLNLPAHLCQEEMTLEYTILYAADGTKLSVTDDISGTSDYYLGPFRYNPDAVSEFDVAVSGGRMVCTAAGAVMNYYIRDHLGSTRVVTNGSGTILQQADYLPYGEKCINPALVSGGNDYLYGGKELQSFIGIPWYDSHARYQNTEGIFSSIDPFCERYYGISPYAYCGGNPINCVDALGRDITIHGANGSSVVVFTSVVNRTYDLSRTGIDFEDNLYFYGIEAARDFFDLAGTFDPTPISDGISALLSVYDGNYSAAALSVVCMFPLGDLAKIRKIPHYKELYHVLLHSHHIIPKAVYRRFEDLTSVIARDGGKNLLDLPAGFHGNHPQYSDWIHTRLNGIKNKYDSLPPKEVEKLIEEAKVEIGKAYEIWQKNGCDKAYNMNEYFRKLNP